MAIHSTILAWKIPWTEEPDRLYSPWGHKELDTTQPSLIHLSDLNESDLKALNGLASPSITLQYHPV